VPRFIDRVNPLAGIAHQRRVWSWISFDVANQSFTLLINTLLFSIFFQEVVLKGSGWEAYDDTAWSLMFALSMLLVVAVSPIAGAMADELAWKKRLLLGTGLVCAGATCALGLLGPGAVVWAMLLYIPANFCFNLGENFLAAFLPELAPREKFGLVSGFSWGIAYSGSLVMLVLTAAVMASVPALADPAGWRWFFVFAGVWFFVFAIPTLLFLKERPRDPALGPVPGLMRVSVLAVRRLGTSVRNTGRHRDLAMLLVASLFYGTGMAVVVVFASIIAKDFGFQSTQLVVFVAVITVSGVVGTLVPTFFQDRIGHRRMTASLLLVWVFTACGLAAFAFAREQSPDPATFPSWPIWIFGNLLGFGLGSLGSANRAFVGYLTPASRSAEVFGLWGLVFKLAGVLTLPFALVKDTLGMPASLLVLAGFVVVGLVLTMLVDERRGALAAAESDGPPKAAPPASPTPAQEMPAATTATVATTPDVAPAPAPAMAPAPAAPRTPAASEPPPAPAPAALPPAAPAAPAPGAPAPGDAAPGPKA
jgi:UMF1 family MFS transporter